MQTTHTHVNYEELLEHVEELGGLEQIEGLLELGFIPKRAAAVIRKTLAVAHRFLSAEENVLITVQRADGSGYVISIGDDAAKKSASLLVRARADYLTLEKKKATTGAGLKVRK